MLTSFANALNTHFHLLRLEFSRFSYRSSAQPRSLARSLARSTPNGRWTDGRTDERSGREDDHLIRDEMPTARPCQPAASHYINTDRRTDADGRTDGPSEPPPLPSSLSPSSHLSSGEKKESMHCGASFLPSFLPSLPSDGRLASQQREVFSAELRVVLCCEATRLFSCMMMMTTSRRNNETVKIVPRPRLVHLLASFLTYFRFAAKSHPLLTGARAHDGGSRRVDCRHGPSEDRRIQSRISSVGFTSFADEK